MKAFVTVGTTKFDSLVNAVTDVNFLQILHDKGYTGLVLQYGGSAFDPDTLVSTPMPVTCYTYKPSIAEDIEEASLVISHAGAGSCLEIMYAKKPCIVVVNDQLMDNHQTELAEKLQSLNHVVFTTPRELTHTLKAFDESRLVSYQPGQPTLFANFLQKALGV